MSGNFVMIVPPGWVEFPGMTAIIEAYSEEAIARSVSEGSVIEVYSLVDNAGLMPPGVDIAECRYFNTAVPGPDRLRLWIRFVNL